MGLLPYVTCVCPACFEEIYLGECPIVSGITRGKVLKTPRGPLARTRVEPLDGRQYTLELARRACTNCQYPLPPNIERVPGITLVVVGDTFSGKSHYIAALIHQLKADWMGATSGYARLTCWTPDVERKYTQEYFKQMFVNRQAIPATQQALKATQEPLIYNLTVSPSAKHPTTSMNLMIYDASGEDYVRAGRLVQYARFVLNTNALIFVVDPFTITPIYRELLPPLQLALKQQFIDAQGSRAADRFGEIISTFERYHGYPEGSSFPDTPIAVMVSKADLFKTFNPPNSFTFMRHPYYGNGINLRDVDTVDEEVKGLLIKYGQNDLLAATKRFKQIKFFATSALGNLPDANNQFQSIEPCRCLDPVLWILHQLRVVRGTY